MFSCQLQKDNQLAPGKNGISLSAAEWHKLADALQEVAAAVDHREDSYELLLSDYKRVTLGEFKYVGGTVMGRYGCRVCMWVTGVDLML